MPHTNPSKRRDPVLEAGQPPDTGTASDGAGQPEPARAGRGPGRAATSRSTIPARPGALLRAALGSGALWGVGVLFAVLGHLPLLAHGARARLGGRLTSEYGRTLAALHATRQGTRRGAPTLLIAANSLAWELEPTLVSGDATAEMAVVTGLPLFSITAFARMLIDYAAPDVLIVPLTWSSFEHEGSAAAREGGPTEWVPHRRDYERMHRYGYGQTSSLLRQVRFLAGEFVPAVRVATVFPNRRRRAPSAPRGWRPFARCTCVSMAPRAA